MREEQNTKPVKVIIWQNDLAKKAKYSYRFYFKKKSKEKQKAYMLRKHINLSIFHNINLPIETIRFKSTDTDNLIVNIYVYSYFVVLFQFLVPLFKTETFTVNDNWGLKPVGVSQLHASANPIRRS